MINVDSKLNLKWYKNDDKYSDGDIEDEIINIIEKNPDKNYSKAVYENLRWPVIYHLTNIRQNILNWYDFNPNSSVLEIGCGMGAITEVLCEKCESVTAVELSKRRATAAYLRNKDADNLEVIVGNLNDIEFDKKFDYITLIGVLEYQGQYTETKNPYVDFLEKIKGLLKEDGKLLIAIENKYGLKYWCGAIEDHTGTPFDGMNQYKIGGAQARTFSKKELNDLILKSGFADTYFYYPMPDYKMPIMVYSQDCLPKTPFKKYFGQYYVPNTTLVIDESHVYDDIIENGVFEFFANSFLVECSNEKINKLDKVQFAASSVERLKQYGVITTITENKVYKAAAYPEALSHIKTTADNLVDLSNHGVQIVPFALEGNVLVSDKCKDTEMLKMVLDACYSKNEDLLYKYFDMLLDELEKSSEETEENIMMQLNIAKSGENADFGKVLKKGYIDMVFKNAFWNGQNMLWIDQEWMLNNIPVKFILYRNIMELFSDNSDLVDYVDLNKLVNRYDLLPIWSYCEKLNGFFIKSIIDNEMNYAHGILRNVSQDVYKSNIAKLME